MACNTTTLCRPTAPCGQIAPYVPCEQCGLTKGYPLGACVTLCQEINGFKLEVVYTSKIPENKTHPVEGSMSTPQTWEANTWCALVNKINNPCIELSKTPDNGKYVGE